MAEPDDKTAQFEEHRAHLRAVAYRMLGSLSEADDAVQETWIRFDRTDTGDVENRRAWLTTVVSRVSLNVLRSRRTRREDPLEPHMPDLILDRPGVTDPEHEALLADSVGVALLVVLDTLSAAERLAFVLHDIFAVPFDEIAPIVERSPEAARQLASRARRRMQGEPTVPDVDLARQREVVDAFLAASRQGDFEALLAVLDPDVVVRADQGAVPAGASFSSAPVRGAENVARRAMVFAQMGVLSHPALVNGVAGAVTTRDGVAFSVGAFTVRGGRIVALDILADPDRLRTLDLTILGA
ncbi:MAG TPA: sigma-70 family RNA polymerase sigma factor [Acidimicrobiales bacterium]|jgi:RNA polymerase sigma-70 factor (ECF subfamily)|nr:sigma-70 family RNA polymerase sigma factor [Acidimicrobiales bacterium]